MNKNNLLLCLIIILAVSLRFFYLGKVPNGLYSDEAAFGYNAYSILMTGKDEYGKVLPLAFQSFGEYKAPLYIYFLVPFIWLFGLTEISVRMISAILGTLTVILTYLLAKRINHLKSFPLLCCFMVAVSPLALQFNRMGHENNLSVILMIMGILFFFFALQRTGYLILSFIMLALSMYARNDARVLAPLIVVLFLFLYKEHLRQVKKKIILGIVIFAVILIPLIHLLGSDAFWNRPRFVSIFSDKGINYETNLERGEDQRNWFFAPSLFHNKILSSSRKLLDNYTQHYSFDFLFLSGDPVKIYKTLNSGILYVIASPFLIVGIYLMFRKKIDNRWFLIIWLLLAFIPAALTRFVPSASRSLSILPSISIIISIGLLYSVNYIRQPIFKKLYIIFITFIFVLNMAYYLHYYYINTPIRYAKEWHFGMREVINQVKNRQEQYSAVWFAKEAWGYIYPLFYLQYPPEKYQPQAKLGQLDEFGFGWVRSFDKYIFDDFPLDLAERRNTLFIGAPVNFYKLKKPLSTIYYPNGDVAFYLADHSSF